MLNLAEFKSHYIVKIRGIEVSAEDENAISSEAGPLCGLDKEFIVSEENMNKDYLTNLIIRHLKAELSNRITLDSFIIQKDNLVLITVENKPHLFPDDYIEPTLCEYSHRFEISISDRVLTHDLLLKTFNFEDRPVLQIKGIRKLYWNLKSGYHHHIDLNEDFNYDFIIICKDDFTKENLTNLIINYMKDRFNCRKIDSNWLEIRRDCIVLETQESEKEKIISDKENQSNASYDCEYEFNIFLNDKKIRREDLKEFFNFNLKK